MTAQQLRKKHPKFTYEKFDYALLGNDLVCKFSFKLEPNIHFYPEVIIKNIQRNLLKKLSLEKLENFIFHLGLAEMPSYWKCAVNPEIEIKAGYINKNQIKWWKKLFLKGLGEFFYINNINPKKLSFRIKSSGPPASEFARRRSRAGKKIFRAQKEVKSNGKKFLVLVGGGKDSLVALKLIKKAGGKIGTMVLGDIKAAHNLIKSCGLKTPIKIEREIDKKLLELNASGYLNGHTPFSSYLAFLSSFCAELFGYGAVVAANERSANEPNLRLGGRIVNHQYSKSYEFEKDFRGYIKKYLTQNINYFSVLRPLYEIQIAKLAAKYPKNLIITKSCNVGMKKNIWCGKCAKCLSVFILLYPFAHDTLLKKMFGKNVLENRVLWRHVPKLVGGDKEKPFECVGTRKENIAALALGYRKAAKKTYIIRRFYESARDLPTDSKIKSIMQAWDNKNFLPADIKKALKNIVNYDILTFLRM